MTYDQKCLELAEHFLADHSIIGDGRRKKFEVELAIRIQEAVEDYLEAELEPLPRETKGAG